MKLSISLILIYLLIIIAVSCKKEKDDIANPVPIPPANINSYPLTIGNSWKYHTNINIDTSGATFYEAEYDHYWNVISDTSIIGIPSTKIAQLDSNYNGTTRLAYSYYSNKPDGFYGMAALNLGSTLFLKNIELSADLSFNLLNILNVKIPTSDTVFVPNPSLQFMKFPIVNNEIWNSYESGAPFKVKRQWLGDVVVTTPAGAFACKKLQVVFDFDDDGQNDPGELIVYQYFSVKGLVKETQNRVINNPVGILSITTELVYVNF